jgi:hypothetical protein
MLPSITVVVSQKWKVAQIIQYNAKCEIDNEKQTM